MPLRGEVKRGNKRHSSTGGGVGSIWEGREKQSFAGAKLDKRSHKSGSLSVDVRSRSGQSKRGEERRRTPGERLIGGPSGELVGGGGFSNIRRISVKSQLIRGALAEATIIGFLRFLNLGERKKPRQLHAMERLEPAWLLSEAEVGVGGLTVPPQMFQVCRAGYEAQTGDLARGRRKKG